MLAMLIARDPAAPAVIPYGTPEWVRDRIGYLTASNMEKAMSFLKNGQESADRRKLKIQILAERMADAAIDHYVTPEMQWGLDMEEAAKKRYAEITSAELMPGGFVHHGKIAYFGATPDAFISYDGLLEIKCPRTETHLVYMLRKIVPDDYKPQMLAQLACTGRKWCDFMTYDPRIKDYKRQQMIVRFEPEREAIAEVERAAITFLAEVEQMWETLNS